MHYLAKVSGVRQHGDIPGRWINAMNMAGVYLLVT